jgi:hypothetical protein
MKIYFGIHFATCFSIWGSMTLTCKQYPTITEGAQTIVTPLVSEEIYVRRLLTTSPRYISSPFKNYKRLVKTEVG